MYHVWIYYTIYNIHSWIISLEIPRSVRVSIPPGQAYRGPNKAADTLLHQSFKQQRHCQSSPTLSLFLPALQMPCQQPWTVMRWRMPRATDFPRLRNRGRKNGIGHLKRNPYCVKITAT